VVLPHPDGPSSAKNSRAKMSSVRPSTAVKSPKRFVTFSKVAIARAAISGTLNIFAPRAKPDQPWLLTACFGAGSAAGCAGAGSAAVGAGAGFTSFCTGSKNSLRGSGP